MPVPLELPRKVIQTWRDFTGDPAFTMGVTYLRHHHAPSISSGTAVEKFEAAVAWNAYQKALNDLEEVLTALPKAQGSLDEPGIAEDQR